MDTVIDVAFIVAITAFIKKQFGLEGKSAMLVAFATALIFGVAPLVGQFIPGSVAWLDVLLKTFTLFLAAAGSYDAVVSVSTHV